MDKPEEPKLPSTRPQDAAAPFLFSPEALAVLDGVEAVREIHGDWTGDRLFLRRPEIYQAIVKMLGESLPVDAIARWLSVSDHTVRSVQEREQISVAEFREHQVKRRRWAMNILVERIIETAPEATLKDAVIAYGILDERQRLDAGAPTQHIKIEGIPAEDEFRRFLAARVASAIDVTETGLDGTSLQQKGLPIPPTEPPSLPPDSTQPTHE